MPRADTITEIAKCLRVDANWLLSGDKQVDDTGSSVKEDEPKYDLRAPAEPSIRQQISEMNRKLDALLDLIQGRPS